ncbi:MAG: hypothetical protein ABI779_12170 [Acidobacteriota bacterium]
MAKIRFTINGPRGAVTLRAMLQAFQNQLIILNDLDATLAGKGEPLLDWVIYDINANSSVTGILASQPRVDDVPIGHGARVGRLYHDGWRVIEGEGEARTPEYYSERALRASKSTLKLIGNGGVTGYHIGDDLAPDEPAMPLTPRGAVNLDQLIRPGGKSYGSVEGRLSVISVKQEKPRFDIVTSLSKKTVSCRFDAGLLDDVKSALGRRVIVTGEITYNSKGEPQKIAMDGGIRELRDRDKLPSTAEMTGAFPDLIGDMTIAEYMEQIRG